MAAPDFKKLHKNWKKAKSDAKLIYEEWARQNTDMSNAHKGVKFDIPAFPKFKLDLGKSLENLEKQKNVDKSKSAALKAITLYEKEIQKFAKGIKKIQPGENKNKIKVQLVLVDDVMAMMNVRNDIEAALLTLK